MATIHERVAAIEASLAEGLREQGADTDETLGHVIAYMASEAHGYPVRVRIDVSRLAIDVERALA